MKILYKFVPFEDHRIEALREEVNSRYSAKRFSSNYQRWNILRLPCQCYIYVYSENVCFLNFANELDINSYQCGPQRIIQRAL